MTFYADRLVKARKVHICGDCRRAIEPGEQYHSLAGAVDGDFWTWRHCAHCGVFRQVVATIDNDAYRDEDGFSLSDWAASYGTTADILWLTRDPAGQMDWIKALGYYRIARWFQTQWKTQDGQLRPVPVLP